MRCDEFSVVKLPDCYSVAGCIERRQCSVSVEAMKCFFHGSMGNVAAIKIQPAPATSALQPL